MRPADPPKGLSRASRELWRDLVGDFDLAMHHLRLLKLLCEALDRAAAAQVLIDAEGVVVTDRFGQSKVHPAVNVRRDAGIEAARHLRELDLEGEVGPDPRIPRRS